MGGSGVEAEEEEVNLTSSRSKEVALGQVPFSFSTDDTLGELLENLSLLGV